MLACLAFPPLCYGRHAALPAPSLPVPPASLCSPAGSALHPASVQGLGPSGTPAPARNPPCRALKMATPAHVCSCSGRRRCSATGSRSRGSGRSLAVTAAAAVAAASATEGAALAADAVRFTRGWVQLRCSHAAAHSRACCDLLPAWLQGAGCAASEQHINLGILKPDTRPRAACFCRPWRSSPSGRARGRRPCGGGGSLQLRTRSSRAGRAGTRGGSARPGLF